MGIKRDNEDIGKLYTEGIMDKLADLVIGKGGREEIERRKTEDLKNKAGWSSEVIYPGTEGYSIYRYVDESGSTRVVISPEVGKIRVEIYSDNDMYFDVSPNTLDQINRALTAAGIPEFSDDDYESLLSHNKHYIDTSDSDQGSLDLGVGLSEKP